MAIASAFSVLTFYGFYTAENLNPNCFENLNFPRQMMTLIQIELQKNEIAVKL